MTRLALRHLRTGFVARAALLVITLTLAGCAGAARTSASAPLPTPSPTSPFAWKFATATAQSWTPTPPPNAAQISPLPGVHPQWRAASLPANFGFSYHLSWLGVSSGNGAVAYTCSQQGSAPGAPINPVETLRTNNAGVTWSRVADINQPWDGCMSVIVDDLNPQIALLGGGVVSAYTVDGGQTWHVSATSSNAYIKKLASVGSRTYAVQGGAQGDTLLLSQDGLASWRDITGPMRGQAISGFWANPVTGALLTVTAPANYAASALTLWLSSDGGATWNHRTAPFDSGGMGDIPLTVRAPGGSSSWQMCLNGGFGSQSSISCSTDSGAHWSALPDLYDAGLRGHGVEAIADDGAVLALGISDTDWRLYRLAPGAARWQSLGSLPPTTGTLLYTHVNGGPGILWSLPSVKGGGSGDANPSDVLSATYPY